MNQKNRQGTAVQVARILGRTSPLVFVVTASISPASRAQEGNAASAVPAPPDVTETTDSRPRSEPPSPSNLRIPLSSLDGADSELLRQLLLSHGIELDLSDPTIADDTLVELIKELSLGGQLDSTPDFELLLADTSELTPIPASADLLEYIDIFNNSVMNGGVSRDWTIKWFTGVDKAVNSGQMSEPDELLQSTQEVSSRWKINLVSTRSATAKELALIEELYCDTAPTIPTRSIENGDTDSVRLSAAPETDSSSSASVQPVTPKQTDSSSTPAEQPATSVQIDNAKIEPTPRLPRAPEPEHATSRQPVVPRPESDTNVEPALAEVSPGWTIKPISTRSATAEELLLIEDRYCDLASPQTSDTPPDSVTSVGLIADNGRSTQIAEVPGQAAEQGSIPQLDIDLAGGTLQAPAPMPSVRGQVELDADLSDAAGESTGGITVSDDVPPGFEYLAGPQTSFVDIFFNERKVGSTSVTATAEEFTLDDPEGVAAMLSGIKDPQAMVQNLLEPMPTNADKICFRDDDPPGCGLVDPMPVAGIFNQDKLRLDLFIASGLQSVQTLDITRYLPPPTSNNTSILSLYAVTSQLQGQESATDLSGRALFGYGNGNVLAEADYNTRTDRQRLREFKLTHYFRDHELLAGSYSFQPGAALSDINLLGVSFATSLKTRVDLEHAFSTELVVYLNRRSVVQIAVNDRIYTAASYAAGNQALDTQLLPDGTYEVEIRILDSLSGSRIERRLFTKSALIPPRGETIYSVTAGVPLLFNGNHILPDTTDTAVAGFSFSNRLNDQSAYRLGLLQFGANTLLQSEYIYLGSQMSLQLATSVGEQNTVASAARAAFFSSNLSFSLSGDWLASDIDTTDDQVLQQLFPTDFRQLGFSVRKSFQRSSIGFRLNYRQELENNDSNTLTQYTLNYRRPLSGRRRLRGFFDVGYQQDDIDRRLTLQVRLFVNHQQWNTSFGGDISRNDIGDKDYNFNVDSDWRSAPADRYDWGSGVYASTGDTGSAVGARISLNHPWFAAGAATGWNQPDNGETQRSSVATLSAHLGVDRRGAAMGGADFAQAGVIVSVKGEPAGARFDILVNGIKSSSAKIGTTQFIGLQPFEVHRVKLIPQTVLSNGLGEEIYEFSLYPGTVQRIDIVAKRQVLLIATLVNKYGELIENAVVESGGNQLLLEAGGFLQAELSPGDLLRVKPLSGPDCEFTVPDSGDEEVLVLDTPILCREIVQDALP